MAKRGRKTFGALSIVTNLPGQRPEPLETLTDLEAAHWRRIAAAQPHDWFTPATFILLAEYCRAWALAETLAQLLPGALADLKELAGLQKLRNDNGHLLMSLATKMRLTQQAKYTEKTAATAAKNVGPALKPWARS